MGFLSLSLEYYTPEVKIKRQNGTTGLLVLTETAYRRKKNQPIKKTDKRLKANRDKPAPNVAQEAGLPELLDHQRMAISVPDECWMLMAGGRGGGKSWTLALLLVRDALRFGKSFRGALLRTDLAGLKKLQQLIEEFCNSIPQLAGTRYLVGQKTFEFGMVADYFSTI